MSRRSTHRPVVRVIREKKKAAASPGKLAFYCILENPIRYACATLMTLHAPNHVDIATSLY